MVAEQRTWCGELREGNAGSEVLVEGWVNRKRDMGGLIFIDLRDRTGIVQVVVDQSRDPHLTVVAESLRNEFVLAVHGTVQQRKPGMANPSLPSGGVEVIAAQLHVLNPAKPLPFELADAERVSEEVRLKYRYLDLRRPAMHNMIALRHRVVKYIRDFLDAQGFYEIETPILTRSTPEGARDYLVPSRIYPGEFYALPQSPQQLKQILMVAGFERYFQIARCFRDEDQRADRQTEFTQLDLEMSFVGQEDVLQLGEELLTGLAAACSSLRVMNQPWRRITYAEAIAKYGSDKPDLRFGMEIEDISDMVKDSPFTVFSSTIKDGGVVRGLRAPAAADYSRKQLDELTELVKKFGTRGLVWIALENKQVDEDGATHWQVRTSAKAIPQVELDAIVERLGGELGDLLLFVADKEKVAANALGRLRSELGSRLKLKDDSLLAFAWVVDFPMFEWNEEEGRWDAQHHPFCMPNAEDIEFLERDPGRVRAAAYDVVCNGYEIASGSVRIHERHIQERIFAMLGYNLEQAYAKFSTILEAFEYGAPPHAGFAPGIERLVMMLGGTENIRDVIAFPKTVRARDLMMDAPNTVDQRQLDTLHLAVVRSEE